LIGRGTRTKDTRAKPDCVEKYTVLIWNSKDLMVERTRLTATAAFDGYLSLIAPLVVLLGAAEGSRVDSSL